MNKTYLKQNISKKLKNTVKFKTCNNSYSYKSFPQKLVK